MRDKVLVIVKSELANAEDDLTRATKQFKNMSPEEMEKEYGQSGCTYRGVLDGHQTKFGELKQCVAWVAAKEA